MLITHSLSLLISGILQLTLSFRHKEPYEEEHGEAEASEDEIGSVYGLVSPPDFVFAAENSKAAYP
jgi:hypothetical protein